MTLTELLVGIAFLVGLCGVALTATCMQSDEVEPLPTTAGVVVGSTPLSGPSNMPTVEFMPCPHGEAWILGHAESPLERVEWKCQPVMVLER